MERSRQRALFGSASMVLSALLGAQAGHAQPVRAGTAEVDEAAELDEVVVTGSRVTTTGNAAPTPVTVLSTEKLLETTPSNIGEALSRLPQFSASSPQRRIQGAGSGSYLNLRRFGVNRNLIMLDGSRLPPTAQNGAVDINMIPTALVQRVDIVTGGASAVYGSDAVTGVVNFILDKNFNGLKGSVQAGATKYGDNENWKFNIVGGTDILGGRGHIEGSYEHYDAAGINRKGFDKRPGIADDPTLIGTGTAANPFRIIPYGRSTGNVVGGRIITQVPGLFDLYFPQNGQPAPFIHGVGGPDPESGGAGAFLHVAWMAHALRTDASFLRFDYDLTDNVNFYVQGSYNAAYTKSLGGNMYLLPGASVLSGNPFIPASVQATMTARNVPQIQLATVFDNDYYDQPLNKNWTKQAYLKTGFTGSLLDDKWKWDLNYGYARSTDRNQTGRQINNLKMAAALDAVTDPATGRIVCQVSLTANASQFPGCVPFNPFGPSASPNSTYLWTTGNPRSTLTNVMHDVSFAISGSPFSLWAGPVQVAINGEYRNLSLRNVSSDPPVAPNCSLLRPSLNCTAATTLFVQGTPANISGKQNVKEAGGEILIPLLKDQPFVQSLELNLAGRYTDYSTSGVVYSWKVGGSWAVNDQLRLRATRSRDIRAPTLLDLFQPPVVGIASFNDIHTGVNAGVPQTRRGNPNLVPETSKTFTAGFVYQPSFIPRLSIALDYYKIQMANAIVPTGISVAFQRECEDSGGASPLCANFVRPLPFSDRTAANFPTQIFIQQLNAASQWTEGVDAEVNYNFDLAKVFSSVPGALSIRALVSYQPVLNTLVVRSGPPTRFAGVVGSTGINAGNNLGVPKYRVNLALNYTLNGLSVSVAERWQSKMQPTDRRVNVDLRPDIPAYSYTDVAVSYDMGIQGHEFTPFINIENLFDKAPPITGYNNLTPGGTFPSPYGFDVFGRTFTVGIRFKM